MRRLHRAAWLLPIVSPPVREGWVLVEGGRIVAAGGLGDSAPAGNDIAVHVHERAAVLPALVNAHTHLELSWLRGRVAPASSMPVWVTYLMTERSRVRQTPGEPIEDAIAELRASGTGLIGDVTNSLDAWDPIVENRLSAAVFYELLGFNAANPGAMVEKARQRIAALPPAPGVRAMVVPHAPYSVSPELMRAIHEASGDGPLSIHLAESSEELQFLQCGDGPWRILLESFGAWPAGWDAPRCGPVEYLDRLGLVTDRLIAVHGVQLDDRELARLAAAGATVVTCPRSNRWVGAGSPPVERFYASGVRVAVGTDSLASVDDLNLFTELSEIRRLGPSVPASRILRSATLDGATALGFGDDLGSIEPGKRADLIRVDVPPEIENVEEYLVSGVPPSAISWLSGAEP